MRRGAGVALLGLGLTAGCAAWPPWRAPGAAELTAADDLLAQGELERARDAYAGVLRHYPKSENDPTARRARAGRETAAVLLAVREELARLGDEVERSQRELARLRESLAARETEAARLREDAGRLRADLARRDADLARLRQEMAARQAEVQRLQADLEHLKRVDLRLERRR